MDYHTRHDFTANAYHTTVTYLTGDMFLCHSFVITYNTRKIIEIAKISHADHRISQSKEFESTNKLLTHVILFEV